MEENFFKVDPETINQNRFSLSKSESKHLIKSLRSNIGDEIWLLDGLGVAYKGLISSINNNCVEGNIVNSFNNYGESKFDIILPGDLIHCDFGISYLTLNTDCQELAYVLKPN